MKNVNIATRCLSAPLHTYIFPLTFSHIHFPTYITYKIQVHTFFSSFTYIHFPHTYNFYIHTFSHIHFLLIHTFSHILFPHIDTYIFLHKFPTYKCMYVTLGTYRRLYVAHTTFFSKMYVCMRHRQKKRMYVRHWCAHDILIKMSERGIKVTGSEIWQSDWDQLVTFS